jgi:hypothetical protein
VGHVGQEGAQRDHESHVELAGEIHHRLREGTPPKVGLGPREQDRAPATQGSDARGRSRKIILGPLDRASDAFYELYLRPHRLVIVELLAVEAPEPLGLRRLPNGAQREARRLCRVVPTREPGDEHRALELRPPLYIYVCVHAASLPRRTARAVLVSSTGVVDPLHRTRAAGEEVKVAFLTHF